MVKLEICPVSEDRLPPTCPRDWPSPEPSPPSHDAMVQPAAGLRTQQLPAPRLAAPAWRGGWPPPLFSSPGRSKLLRGLSRTLPASPPPAPCASPGSAAPPGSAGRCHLNGRHDTACRSTIDSGRRQLERPAAAGGQRRMPGSWRRRGGRSGGAEGGGASDSAFPCLHCSS